MAMEYGDLIRILILVGFIVVVGYAIYIGYLWYTSAYEHYGDGALLQLMAKGPMDTYLSEDAEKYIPPWYQYFPRYYSLGHLYYPYYTPDYIYYPYE